MAEVQMSTHLGLQSVDVSADKTLAISDGGIVQNAVADGKVFTLPAVGSGNVGLTFVVRNGGVPATGGAAGAIADALAVTISPNASDKIMGLGVAGTDNKDIVNTKATSRVGDYIVLVSDGVNGWFVKEVSGTWAFEA